MDKLEVNTLEAAKILGVTSKTIQRHRERGLLRFRREGHKILYLTRDVETLKRISGDLRSLSTSQLKLAVLLDRLLRCERDIELLKLITGEDIEPFELDPAMAENLYLSCLAALGQDIHELSSIESWARMLMGLNVAGLDLIARVAQDPQPWRPLLELADKMLIYLSSRDGFGLDLTVQMIHGRLLKGRNSLRQEAFLFEADHKRLDPALTKPTDVRKSLLGLVTGTSE